MICKDFFRFLIRGAVARTLGITLLLCCGFQSAFGQVSVLTQRNDTSRSGLNLAETRLNTSNVAPGTFGKLFSRVINGRWSQQPLVASGLNIGGSVRNVVYICSGVALYAFDADDATKSAPLWVRYLSHYNVFPEVYSTPVIDPQSNTIYLCGRFVDGPRAVTASWHVRLWALDLITGQDKISPVDLAGTIPGTGIDSNGDGTLSFNPSIHINRPGLLLANGNIYIACGPVMDSGQYHGWFFSYNAQTLQQTGIYCTSPNRGWIGLWMSGNGPAADALGNVYVVSANAQNSVKADILANAVLKFAPTSPLTLVDFFMPSNATFLNRYNLDVGVGGVVLTPDGRLITGSKQGKIFVLDQNNLGGFGTSDNIIQSFQAANKHIHGNPVLYDGPTGKMLYAWGEEDYLKAFLEGPDHLFISPSVAQSVSMAPHGMPGGLISVSANGKVPNSGIVWVNLPAIGTALGNLVPCSLHAYDAADLHELWTSGWNYIQRVGTLAKYAPPTVANGRVYIPTLSNTLEVYGLLSSSVPQAPARLLADGAGTKIRVYWTATPNTLTYKIARGLAATGPFTTIGDNLPTNSFVDTSPKVGTKYYYVVTSVNSQGTGVPSLPVSATLTSNASNTTIADGIAAGVQSNGLASSNGATLSLTDATSNAAGAGFLNTLASIRTFHTTFRFQAGGDFQGITYAVQGVSLGALGAGGAMLGYGPDSTTAKAVTSSVAIAFVAKDGNGSLVSKSGILFNGEPPASASRDLSTDGIDLNSGHPFVVDLAYNGVNLSVTIQDTVSLKESTYTQSVNIPSVVGLIKGYIGFTGSTGALGGSINVSSWTYGMND